MKKFFAIILGIFALGLALTAAFYSVFGLSQLFIGAATAVIVLASILELSKIVIVSFLHQFWKHINGIMKGYMIVAICALMLITSTGIYGFLSSAYSITATELSKIKGQTEVFDKKIELKNSEKIALNSQIENKNQRVKTLSELRTSQEVRIDSLYQKGWYNSARETEKIVKQANEDIKLISTEVTTLNEQVQIINDSITFYEMEKLDLNTGELAGEVAPLKYIAQLTGKEMNSIVNWLILVLIFLVDPLAVCFVLATNKVVDLIRIEKQAEKELKSHKRDLSSREEILTKKELKFHEEKLNSHEEILTKKEPKEEDLSSHEEVLTKKEFKEEGLSSHEEVLTKKEPKEEDYRGEKSKSMAEYVANTKGNFVKKAKEKTLISVDNETMVPGVFTANTSNSIVQKIDDKNEYLILLNEFYQNGTKKEGDAIPIFTDFKQNLQEKEININENILQDFLMICGLLKITQFNDKQGIFNKSFEDAKDIILKI